MARRQLGVLFQHIDKWTGPAGDEPTDAQLVERFIAMREEAAFECLVRRHGALVLRVCRRVLSDAHAAEDAFQATFLVLVRKAGSIRRHESVSSWLYGVAYRVARKARLHAARRQAQTGDLPDIAGAGPPEAGTGELRQVLDEELVRLAEKHRAPLVLCYLEGKTYGQAARELGMSEGSMSRRLAQAREELRQRLVQRGIALSSAGLAAALASEAKAAVPAALIDATLLAAGTTATGTVAALVGGILMAPLKFKLAAGLLMTLGTLAIGAGLATHWGTPSGPGTYAFAAETTAPILLTPFEVGVVTNCPEDTAREAPNMESAEPPAEPMNDMLDPPPFDPAELEPLFQLPPPPKIAIQRRDRLGEEEHRRRLALVPELSLDAEPARKTSALIAQRARQPEWEQEQYFTPNLLASRSDLAGLPMRKRGFCQLDEQSAHNLSARSRDLRRMMVEASDLGDSLRIAGTLRLNFYKARGDFKECFGDVAAVPTLMQMLTPEEEPVRRVLVEQLGRIAHPSTSAALARLALFDLSAEVRASAIEVLASRPVEEYRSVLVEGFRYPWAPVADHAAEALVALQDRGAVPMLHQLVDQPDPAGPIFDAEQKTHVVRELVRVNHLRNCLLCHAPSLNSEDRVRAPVPVPGEPLPPPLLYYSPNREQFVIVRADVTYLRQDFSTMHAVAKADPWPTLQRYDYLVRSRPVPPPAAKTESAPRSYPQREAVLYALKELQAR
jgi:RNA polymerase sigma factor (sigma-70 family)